MRAVVLVLFITLASVGCGTRSSGEGATRSSEMTTPASAPATEISSPTASQPQGTTPAMQRYCTAVASLDETIQGVRAGTLGPAEAGETFGDLSATFERVAGALEEAGEPGAANVGGLATWSARASFAAITGGDLTGTLKEVTAAREASPAC